MDNEKCVTLRNGASEFEPLVRTMSFILRNLMEEKPITLYELVKMCRDPQHKPWGGVLEQLRERRLVEERPDGTWGIYDSIRNIVLSSAQGDVLDLTLVSPVAKAAPEEEESCQKTQTS